MPDLRLQGEGPAAPQAGLEIEVSVVDQSKLAVPAVRVQLKSGDVAPIALDTDENGRAVFLDLRPAKYRLSLAPQGFEPIGRDLDLDRKSTRLNSSHLG